MFTHGTFKNEVNPGDNVTFACIAKGNPPPEVKWHYDSFAGNVRVTTGGSQESISVTGATSTNAGVYRCVATNKVGSVTTSVTLIMKGIITDYVHNTYGNVYSEVVTGVAMQEK